MKQQKYYALCGKDGVSLSSNGDWVLENCPKLPPLITHDLPAKAGATGYANDDLSNIGTLIYELSEGSKHSRAIRLSRFCAIR